MKTSILILFFPVLIFAQKNLISNGNFDTNTDSWRGDTATSNRFYKKTGAGSCMINQFVGNEWKGIDQISAIPKDVFAIAFSVYIKSDGIEGGKETYNAGVMTVEFTTSSGQNISYESIAQVTGTTDWVLYKKTVVVPADARKFRTMLALAQTAGTIYFDDVKAIAISEAAYQQLISQKN